MPFDTGFVQRLSMALTGTAEYIVKVTDPATTNYADLALFARMVAANPAYYGKILAWLVACDGSITTASTDQAILDRVWTIWPVVSYKAAAVPYPTTGQ